MEDNESHRQESRKLTPEPQRNEARKSRATVTWTEGLEESEPFNTSSYWNRRRAGGAAARLSFGRLRFAKGGAGSSSRWSCAWSKSVMPSTTTSVQRRMLWVAFVVVLFMVVSIGIVVAVLYRNKAISREQMHGCYTQECVEASAYIEGLINNSIDPCTDFYGHVCSKWQHERDGEGFIKDAVSTFLRNLHDKIQYLSIRSRPIPEAMSILVSLYLSCDKFLSGDRSFNEVVTTSVKLFGIPRLLQCSTLREVIVHVIRASLTRGASTTFKLQLERFGSRSHLLIQRGSPLSERFIKSDGKRAFKRHIEDVVAIVAPNASAEEVTAFDKKVESVRSSVLTVEWIPFHNLGNLMRLVPAEVWRDVINAELPADRKIAHDDAVLARGYGEIKQVMELASLEPIPLIAAYMSLHILLDVLIVGYSAQDRYFYLLEKIRMCHEVTKKALPVRWVSIVSALMPQLAASSNSIRDIYEDVKQSFIEHNIPTWMDAVTRRKAQARANATTLRLYQDYASAVDTDEVTIPTLRGDFLQDYSALLQFSHTKLLQDPLDYGLRQMEDIALSDRPFYCEVSRSILIPPVLQQRPIFYYVKVASYFNYGTLGALVAREIARAIGPRSLIKKPSGEVQDWWSSFTRWNFIGVSKCYNRLYWKVEHQQEDKNIPNLAPVVEEGVFSWTYAARVALDGMRRRHSHISSEWSSELQTFFRRFCLLSCDVHDAAKTLSKLQCVVPLMNMEAFASAFECPDGSFMNQRERCS